MINSMVIEVKFNGEKRVLEGMYTYEEACEVQEAMEILHSENSYLIYSYDQWMLDCEQ